MGEVIPWFRPGGELSAEGRLAADTAHLRFLARQVTTAEQFDAIIDTIEDPMVRAAVRDHLIPMLTFPYVAQDEHR